MPQTKKFIVLDQGSSSSRAFLFSENGEILAREQAEIRAAFPGPGMAEYDAQELLDSQLKTLKSLPKADVAGIGIASQRSTVVLWDKNTGKPPCPAISWQDGRGIKELEALQKTQPETHALTGLYKTPYYSASKILWALKHRKEVKAAAESGSLLIGSVATYILWHMTGGKTFAMDATLAQRTLLFDINSMTWSDELLKAFGTDKKFLPTILPVYADYGEFEGVPIRAMTGDQQAALAFLTTEKDTAAANYGTGAFFLARTGEANLRVPGLLTSVAWQNEDKTEFMLEGTVNSAASTLDWLAQIGINFDKTELDGMCRASKNPVTVLAALGGIGSPHWDYQTSTTMTGFSPATKKEDIIRGCAESIALMLADSALLMKTGGANYREIVASGGLAHSDWLLQFQSDILQTPIVRAAETETTASGIAFWLAKGSGCKNWKGMQRGKTFTPQITKEQAELIFKRWTAFRQSCKSLTQSISSAA